ncbi:MAG: folate-binding protein [Beijerinckiaceae bacterium]|nr:MAG: folate-binding protein [Beijerinckiaceae bacterium]
MSETSPGHSPAPHPAATPTAIRLEERALIAVAGADANHFLGNLLTADIAGLTPGSGRLAALLTPQGKIIADMLVFDASDDEPLYLIDVARAFAEELARKLTQYRLRAAVSIDLLPTETAIVACLDAPAITGEDFYTFPDPRDSALGQRLYGPAEAIRAATAHLRQGEPATYHARRIALGIPEGGRDYLTVDTFPHEANLDQLGAVDFRKGCYIGQEIVSRMEHRGTARTRALCVRFLNGFGVLSGAEIIAGEKILGKIGECVGDRSIGFIRLDRLEEAAVAGEVVSSGGVPIAIEKPHYARFVTRSV